MNIEKVPIEKLKEFDKNPRKISDEELKKLENSLKKFGFVEPLVVNKDNTVIGGHQRLIAARKLGLRTIPVYYVDLPENEARTLNIALNKISGEWDEALLGDLLKEMEGNLLELSGFVQEELDELLSLFLSPDELETDFNLSNSDRNEFGRMGFSVSEEQRQIITEALNKAKKNGLESTDNENSNGNALTEICKSYNYGQS